MHMSSEIAETTMSVLRTPVLPVVRAAGRSLPNSIGSNVLPGIFVLAAIFACAALPATSNGQSAIDTNDQRYFELESYGSAAPGKLGRPVTMNETAADLTTLVRSVATQAELSIAFDTDRLSSAPRRSINVRNAPAASVLVDLLHGTGLHALVGSDWSIVIIETESSM